MDTVFAMTNLSTLPPETGIGLKPEHYAPLLESLGIGGVQPGWVEVHPQNYFGAGGPPHRWLTAIAEHLPLSFHSIGLSLGGAAGCNIDELEQLAALADRYQPAMISDHLSWSDCDGERYPDLLPLPYTVQALDHFVAQVGRVQDRLGRQILIENPSRYVAWAADDIPEAEFLNSLCRRSGCGLLLDINNVEVSATNLNFDPLAWLDAIDLAAVGEIHLAGHAVEHHESGVLLIDDHGSPVTDDCWSLYAHVIDRAGRVPTLIERDTAIPPFAVLMAEVARADAVLEACWNRHALAA
jgi:uncharacterized protein